MLLCVAEATAEGIQVLVDSSLSSEELTSLAAAVLRAVLERGADMHDVARALRGAKVTAKADVAKPMVLHGGSDGA
jgi:hypothetical protein